MNKKIILLAILLALTACSSPTANVTKDTVKIGFIGPLTGDASQWGIPPMEGVKLASENYKVIYEDSACDSKKAVSAANKLINVNKVDAIIGAVCSSSTLAIAPITEESNVLLISPASTNPKISEAGDYVFRVVPSDSLRGHVFAEYVKEQGVNDIAFLYVNNNGGKGGMEAFTEKFEELGGNILSIESYEQRSTDLRTQLTKIKNTNPEAIVVSSYPQDTTILLKQASELRIRAPLYFNTESMEDPEVIKSAGDSAEGIIYVHPAEAEGKTPANFRMKFEEEYGREPNVYAAEGYDAYNLLSDAYDACGKDNDCVKNELLSVKNYEGASGTITFDENGDVVKPMAIKKIVNGQKQVISVI